MVGFSVSFYFYQIGSADFLHSFFSTVAYRLEDGKWGQHYPYIMNQLYHGELCIENVHDAILELQDIQKRFTELTPNKVIWDIDDLSKQPPWGTNISTQISNLSNYYITSDGEDFITQFEHALQKAKEMNQSIKIVSL